MKKILSMLLTIAMLFTLAAPVSAAGGYTISKESATISIGQTLQLRVLKNGAAVSGVVWASNDPTVASVDSTGRVKGVSAGSTTIIGAVNGTMVECLISVIKKSTSTTKRYNVLIIDNSGSMRGDPFKKEKTAAKRFCKTLLNSDGDNYIAVIVLTKTSAKAACKFSQSYKKLSAAIDKPKANSGTNLNAALKKAGDLLKSVSSGSRVMKNVILCSDGLGKDGATLKKGRYTAKDNRICYKYANKTYKTDVALKNKNYFIYALGFYQNATGKNLVFGKRHMKDLASKDKYYEIKKSSDYEKAFKKIAEQIVSVTINKKSLTLKEGQSYQLRALKNGATAKAKWKSSNKAIVTVNSSGKIKAKKAGTCKITATVDGHKVTCIVKVKAVKKKVKASLSVSPKSITIYAGKSKTLKAVVKGKSKTVKWSSSNTKIAKVNKNGKVTGIKKGSAVITAKANGKVAKVKVKVVYKHPSYSFYITHKAKLTPWGPKKINEQGAQIVYNKGGKIKKCGVYIYKSFGKYYFIIACTGTNLTSVEINNYLGYNGKILYDSYNTRGHSYYMNRYSMYRDYNGVWSKGGSYGQIYFNATDMQGSLLTNTKAGADSKNVKIFKDLNKMKAWLNK